jgi:hypothetical protein
MQRSRLVLAVFAWVPLFLWMTSVVGAQSPAWSSTVVGSSPPSSAWSSRTCSCAKGRSSRRFPLTKRWTSVTCVFGNPVTYNYNEHLLVKDGPMSHAYHRERRPSRRCSP